MTLPPVYGILDGGVLQIRGLDMVVAAEALLEGGIRLLQIRWKATYTREVYAMATQIADLCRSAGAQLVIDDRADIALLLHAGVHTGQDDLAPSDIRRIAGPETLLGVSTHNREQFLAASAAPVDYIALGPVYGTLSKERPGPTVGVEELATLRKHFGGPVVAIGGVTRERAPQVWQAGADSIAVIGDLYPAQCTASRVRSRAEEWTSLATRRSRP